MEEKFTFPTTETFKIGRITYRVSALFDEKSEALKPKVEKLLRREIETGYFDNNRSQKSVE